ncbi:unnamed protein product [Phytomonas sp. Hart1]|nr:unnamed protein product [Phytomonas sp. Hart1]|eukprot:CCW71704.1 unnamed protein product [Phytomonas sp. isolate Hart1]
MSYPFQPVASLKGRSVAAAGDFSLEEIEGLIDLALAMRGAIASGTTLDVLRGRLMVPLFFEDSSRTRSSFCAAMLRLGGQVLDFNIERSSVNKGETLQDTIRAMDSYADVMVLRHPQVEALAQALAVATHPILNAGNGAGEHPSQSLLDLLTIKADLGRVDGLTIAFIGDLKMGRTVHSLLRLLCGNYNLRKVYLIAPEGLEMPEAVLDSVAASLKERGIALESRTALAAAVVADCDVLYCTRLQKERFASAEAGDARSLAAFEAAKEGIRVDRARMRDAKKDMIVMHPLPRVDELSTDIDDDPRAAYFRQMQNGLYMRMALLYSILV